MDKKKLYAVIWPLKLFVHAYDAVEKEKIEIRGQDWFETDTERFVAITKYEQLYWQRFDGYIESYKYDWDSLNVFEFDKYREITEAVKSYYIEPVTT